MVGGWTSITLPLLLLALWLSAPVLPWPLPSKTAHAEEEWTGQRIMKEAFKRHHLSPYVYEEQTMILMDSAGHRDVRDVRRFSRVESDGTVKFLLVFDNPAEVRGVALLAIRYPSGKTESGVYLPAFGKKLNFQASFEGDPANRQKPNSGNSRTLSRFVLKRVMIIGNFSFAQLLVRNE